MFRTSVLSAVSCLVCTASGAQETDAAHSCEQVSQSEFIHIAVCAEDIDDDILAQEGARLCEETLPCGVWFWRNVRDAPANAPVNHDGLTEAQVTSATGVWVAEKELFIRIEPVED